jgi:hypothetical protein
MYTWVYVYYTKYDRIIDEVEGYEKNSVRKNNFTDAQICFILNILYNFF